MRESYFLGRWLPIGKSSSAGPDRFGGEDQAASVSGRGVGRGAGRLRQSEGLWKMQILCDAVSCDKNQMPIKQEESS
jgi:hypothetical protein